MVLLGCCLSPLLVVASACHQLMLVGIDSMLDGCWHRSTLAGHPLVLLLMISTENIPGISPGKSLKKLR